jgi:hypothetical protein
MMVRKRSCLLSALAVVMMLAGLPACVHEKASDGGQIFDLGTGLVSRSISFENPSGEPGEGGQTASNLGVGRKGFPARNIESGETVVLCDIEG